MTRRPRLKDYPVARWKVRRSCWWQGAAIGVETRWSFMSGSSFSPKNSRGLFQPDRLDHHVLYRDVCVTALPGRLYFLDLVNHVHALDDLAEDAVAHAVPGVGLVE